MRSPTVQQQIDQKRQQLVELYERGQYERAIPIAARVCDLTRQAYGQDHPDYAGSLNNLAEVYRAMGDYAAAEPLFRQALDITRRALDQNHPEVAPILGNLAGGEEFESLVLNLWLQSRSSEDLDRAFEHLGDSLLAAQEEYVETKRLEEALFGDEYE